MSLFICEKCGKVENHSSVCDNNVMAGDVPDQWNMGLMEMHGQGDIDLKITQDGKEYVKNAKNIYMLCYECNTGKVPTDNERFPADEEEIELSKYSKYRYITPFDHEEGSYIGNNNDGYKLNPVYRDIHNAFRNISVEQVKGLIKVHETCHLKDNKYLLVDFYIISNLVQGIAKAKDIYTSFPSFEEKVSLFSFYENGNIEFSLKNSETNESHKIM